MSAGSIVAWGGGTFVFDLDGTISDPAEGIGRSINHALTAMGFAALGEDDVSACIGPPLDVSFRRLTNIAEPAAAARFVALYRERYAAVGYAENRLYDGIPAALGALSARGVRLGLCTSKRVDFAEQILALFGLRDHFAFVSGGDIGISKTDQLRDLLTRGAIDARATMIGDRDIDVHAARAHGLASVGVLWGHGSEAELRAAAPDRLLADPVELLALAG